MTAAFAGKVSIPMASKKKTKKAAKKTAKKTGKKTAKRTTKKGTKKSVKKTGKKKSSKKASKKTGKRRPRFTSGAFQGPLPPQAMAQAMPFVQAGVDFGSMHDSYYKSKSGVSSGEHFEKLHASLGRGKKGGKKRRVFVPVPAAKDSTVFIHIDDPKPRRKKASKKTAKKTKRIVRHGAKYWTNHAKKHDPTVYTATGQTVMFGPQRQTKKASKPRKGKKQVETVTAEQILKGRAGRKSRVKPGKGAVTMSAEQVMKGAKTKAGPLRAWICASRGRRTGCGGGKRGGHVIGVLA